MNSNLKNLIRAALFLAIAIIFQFLGKSYPEISQLFVGSVVNATLLLTVSICGLSFGLAVGALTPILAWTLGQLPAPFGPFIPFIILGNWILILIFFYFYKLNLAFNVLGIILSAMFKFLFLFISAKKIVVMLHIITNTKIASKLSIAMGFLQLITALIGGIMAIVLLQLLKNRKQI